MSGLELTRSLKRSKDTEEIPVIMLTARAEEQDKVGGLEGGADDYITKPFSPRELLARIQAVLRRAAPAGAADIMEVEGLKLDDSSHRVSAGEREIALGTHRIPLAAFLHDPSGAGVQPRSVARPGVGRQYLRGRAYSGRAHPPVAQGTRALSCWSGWCRPCAAPATGSRRGTHKRTTTPDPWQRCGRSRSRGSRAS